MGGSCLSKGWLSWPVSDTVIVFILLWHGENPLPWLLIRKSVAMFSNRGAVLAEHLQQVPAPSRDFRSW